MLDIERARRTLPLSRPRWAPLLVAALCLPQVASAQTAEQPTAPPQASTPPSTQAAPEPSQVLSIIPDAETDTASETVSDAHPERTEADEVVITIARRKRPQNAIPNTIKLIDNKAMNQQLQLSSSLLDSLSFSIPSLAPGNQKMTSSGVTLRGRIPLYLVDGIPQSTPLRNGERSGFTIDPAFVERVEVIYGSNAMQGVGATGGIINYVTVSAAELEQPMVRVSSSISNDDFGKGAMHYRTSGLAGTKLGDADIMFGASIEKRGMYYDGHDHRVAVNAIQGDLADSLSYNLFGKLGYAIDSDQRLEASANFFRMDSYGDFVVVPGNRSQGLTATSKPGDSPLDPAFNRAINLSLSYTNDDLAGGELSLAGYYYTFRSLYGGGTFDVFQDPTLGTVGEYYDQSALVSNKSGAKASYTREDTLLPGLQLAVGMDYLRDQTYQELAQSGRTWVPPMEFSGWAPFVQLEQALFDQGLRLSGGLRWENVQLDVADFRSIYSANRTFVQGGKPKFDKLLGNVGAVLEPFKGLSVFASYSQGFTMPDAGLIFRSVNTPDQTVDDLVDIQPVLADNREFGATYQRQGLRVSGNYFWSDSDLGTRIEVVDGAGQIRRERTEISGLELSGSYTWFGPGLEVGAAYAKLNGKFDSDADNLVDKDLSGRNIGPNRLNAYFEAGKYSDLSGRVQASMFFDRDFAGGEPDFNFKGFTLLDVSVAYNTGKLGKVSLGVQNLMDHHYASYTSQTITYVNDSTFIAGRGRVATVNWTVEADL